jgi:hypothetical protein
MITSQMRKEAGIGLSQQTNLCLGMTILDKFLISKKVFTDRANLQYADKNLHLQVFTK